MDKGLGGKFLLCEHCGMWTRGWVVSSCYVNIVVCGQEVRRLIACYVNTLVCRQGVGW